MLDTTALKKQLTKSEFTLLDLLIKREGQIVSREEIAQQIYPESNINGVSNESIDQIVSRLRKALGNDGKVIKTKPKIGYFYEETSELISPVRPKGKLIVFYGADKVGKTTQIMKLVEKFIHKSHQSFIVIRYPLYGLQPTGPKIDDVLHGQNLINIDKTSMEFQKLFSQNRIDFQHTLADLINTGIDVIAEGYSGTGIAKGLSWGHDLKELENINFGTIPADFSILIDSPRHTQIEQLDGITQNQWDRYRIEFKFLAEKYKWKIIDGGKSPDEVHKDVCKALEDFLRL